MSIGVNWVSQKPTFNTTGSNQSPNFALDSQSNIYVVYDTDSVASGQTSSGMRDIVVFKLDQFGVTQWVQQQPSFNTSGNDTLPDISIDASDNIYVAYQTSSTVSGQTHDGAGTDIVVFKMDTVYGSIQWIVQQPSFNTSMSDLSPSIVTDTQGYIYVGYHTQGGTASGQSHIGVFDIVIFKLEPLMGGCLWVIQQPAFDGPISNTYVHLAIGHSGNLYCSYQIIGAVSGQVYSGGLSDIVVFKIEPTHGECLWVSQTPSFNTKGTDTSCCLAIDSLDHVYVAYQSNRAVSGQTYTGGLHDIVVFKLEPTSGMCMWVTEQPTFNTTSDDTVPSISVNEDGYVYVCYDTNGIAPGQTYTGGDHDIVILKMEPTHGQCMWINELPIFNTPGDDLNPKIISDQSGNLFVTYQTTSTPTSGGQTLTGITDIIVYNLSPPSPHIRFLQYYGQFSVPVPVIGTPVSYTFEVENYGGLPVYNIIFNDNLDPTPYTVGTLVPGQKVTKTITRHLVTQDDFDFGRIYSQATVDGRFFDTVTSDYSEFSLALAQIVSMLVTKQAVAVDKFIGGYITYEITAKNVGNVPFNNLFLNDPKLGIHDQLLIDTLIPGQTFLDTEYLLITEEIYKEWTIVNVASITASDTKGVKHTYSAEDVTTLCLMRDSQVMMIDNTTKSIQDLKRGDIVSPGHTVARLCEIKLASHLLTELAVFEPNCLGPNLPKTKLSMTSNHPIVFANARRPARCFTNLNGVTLTKVRGLEILYDLQFEHDGTYFANGVEVQSCSPRSAANPLPKDLYFDPTLYSDEVVWDAYEQQTKLISDQLNPRVLNHGHIKRKNHLQRLEQYRKKLGEDQEHPEEPNPNPNPNT